MNKYETIFLISNKITKEDKEKVVNKIKKYLSKNGKIIKTDDLGTKKLAYEIKKHNVADYYLIEFECDADKILELERLYRITEEILKFIVVRKDD